MKNNNFNSKLREGDSVQTEWSQISYDLWCREKAAEFVTFPERRVVDLYKVVRSVIENDFSPAEQRAAKLHWYDGMSVSAASKLEGIPVILLAIGIVCAFGLMGISADSAIQGVLLTGTAVFGNQLVKQLGTK